MKYAHSFRKLIVWKQAKELSLYVYENMDHFPKSEQYALCSQLKRASYSIVANIAEGNNRRTKKDKTHFFTIALASLTELDCLLELSYELHFIENEVFRNFTEQVNKVGFLLRRLIEGAEKKLS